MLATTVSMKDLGYGKDHEYYLKEDLLSGQLQGKKYFDEK